MNTFHPADVIFFAVLPYVAIVLFLLVSIYRYVAQPFTYSSLTSQFLENRKHFWGLVPLHYGIIVILIGHLIGILIPRHVLLWNSIPARLYVLEASALAFGVLALIGIVQVLIRRTSDSKTFIVTSAADWIVYFMLLAQILTGVFIAVGYGWGSSWFATLATPYIWSLFTLSPDISAMAPLPWLVKLHIIIAFSLIAFAPFTRLVHILVAPIPYLWRKPQVVRWYNKSVTQAG